MSDFGERSRKAARHGRGPPEKQQKRGQQDSSADPFQ